MKYVEQAEILENTAIIPAVWKMVFRAPKMAAQAKPGQFVNVHYDGGTTFLRRPFGIVDADAASGAVTIIYRIVGTGTAEFQRLRAGDCINAEGPLGDGTFTTTPGKVLVVGGGIGLAPRTAEETFWADFFAPYAEQVYIATDDGSRGIKGYAVAAIPQIAAAHQLDRVSVCGPTIMMQTVAQAAETAGITCEVSMEKRMACGIGVCLGCTFASKLSGKRYKVCADGPVFPAKEVF